MRTLVEINLGYAYSNNRKILLQNSTVDKVVKEVFNTIKTELPEEAQTVEVLDKGVSAETIVVFRLYLAKHKK